MKTFAPQGIEPNGGGGALSSNVSKLGSKEVSKKLRNFSLASKKACHCEDERSEDVAIAKSLNINEITTQSSIARNDKYRYAELADCELRAELDGKMAKPLQTSIVDPLNASNQAVSGSQTDTVFSRFTSHFSRKRVAFTLAEVLITLGIIGVVAALTLPSVIQNYKKQVTVNQLKKAYSVLGQVAQKAFADNGPAGFEEGSKIKGDDVKAFFDTYWLPYFKGVEVYPENISPKLNDNMDYYKMANGIYTFTHACTKYDAGRIFFSTSDGMTYFVYMNNWVNKYDENGNLISQDAVYMSNQLVYVDVNGIKPPNTFGKDVFMFVVDFDNGFVRPDAYRSSQATVDNECKTSGMACTSKIMREGWKINY